MQRHCQRNVIDRLETLDKTVSGENPFHQSNIAAILEEPEEDLPFADGQAYRRRLVRKPRDLVAMNPVGCDHRFDESKSAALQQQLDPDRHIKHHHQCRIQLDSRQGLSSYDAADPRQEAVTDGEQAKAIDFRQVDGELRTRLEPVLAKIFP